jgi:lipooligosaccharide transport system permease protein
VSGFAEPLFYLLSFGSGLSGLVSGVAGPGGQSVSYAQFIAPALLASSAMNGAVFDSTMNIFFKLKFAKLYDAMLATSLGPLDVAMGEIGWALTRGGLYSVGFLIVMLAMGLTMSWWALLLVPAAVVVAFGFASVGMAVTTYFRNWQDLELVNLIILPMFLFSGTFYSLDVYPAWARIVVECLPLHHAVATMRSLNGGQLDAALAVHLAYFVVMAAAGTYLATRRLGELLLT